MISLLNTLSTKWFSYICETTIQFFVFFLVIFTLSILWRNRSAKFLYGLWLILLIKAVLPPSLPLPIRQPVSVLPHLTLPETASVPQTAVAAVPSPHMNLSFYLMATWLMIVLFLSIFIVMKNRSFRRQLLNAKPFPPSGLPQNIAVFQDRNEKVPVYLLNNIHAPLTYHLIHPKIYLPEEARHWESQKLQAVLLHEIAHMKRKDLWVGLVQTFIQVVYFFNPFVWIMNWQLNVQRERACDDYAILKTDGISSEYPKYLLSYLNDSVQRREFPALVQYFFTNNRTVLKRFEYITQKKEVIMLRLKRFEKLVLLLGLFAILGFILANSGLPDATRADLKQPLAVGKIVGKVVDDRTGEPIPAANIAIEGTNLGAASDKFGSFVIENIPPGVYSLLASMVGFEPKKVEDVHVREARDTQVEVRLVVGSLNSNEYVVSETQQRTTRWAIANGSGKIVGKVTNKRTGEALPGANVVIEGTRLGSATDKAGEYKIKDIPPGTYNVLVRMIGFKPTRVSQLSIKEDELITLDIALEPSPVTLKGLVRRQESIFRPYDQPPQPIGGFAAIQRKLHYPEVAKRAGIEGTVILSVLVDEKGNIIDPEVVKSIGNNACEEAAIAAVQSVDWKPAQYKGQPAKVRVFIPVVFALHKDKTQPSGIEESVPHLPPQQELGKGDAQFVPYDVPPEPIGGFAAIQKNLVYPEQARKKGAEGTVIAQVLINASGQVEDVKVVKSFGNPDCDQAAMNAIRNTTWKPAMQGEKPVKVWVSMPIIFSLKDQGKSASDAASIPSKKEEENLKEESALNYPNPFNPSTVIKYTIQEPAHVTINIYNLKGQIIRTLVDKDHPAGSFEVIWDGTDSHQQRVASGQYFYQIIANDKVITKKMLKIQ